MAKIARLSDGRRALIRPLAATVGVFLLSPASLTELLFGQEAMNGVVSVSASGVDAEIPPLGAEASDDAAAGSADNLEEGEAEAPAGSLEDVFQNPDDISDFSSLFGGENGLVTLNELFSEAGGGPGLEEALKLIGGGDADAPKQLEAPEVAELAEEVANMADGAVTENSQALDAEGGDALGGDIAEAAGAANVEDQIEQELAATDDLANVLDSLDEVAEVQEEANDTETDQSMQSSHARAGSKMGLLKKVAAVVLSLLAGTSAAYFGHRALRRRQPAQPAPEPPAPAATP
ncbi:conserved hypothetical protein [Neospora caninum Liverpool]|uniref:Uncharacterized protein n=1 Tax=Neospora caninum (strain Liverpool) TaxID=572307 RepID=F0VRS6_NEOCL|nr:conserved hypothetical protein [Neospora caninum Liverpool]CBZ56424.1 conserved hypothetical protein [Neospora caninum Liverpool]CEL71183.1 TPA: hypothetical protein BN1204_068480 [Neospora caninum Liverpool]|eukprot:XP_003886449.1 conserved hypothetical protein [Neospora caninum Liverpool]